ncbi:MAG: hypothetical protein O7D34_02115 [Ignavibacteria bacterium]|nr:hypothetical protein [Ignavibacteria bacterium]
MNPRKISIVNMEGLTELLDEMFNKSEAHSKEEVDERFKRSCRLAYNVTRDAMDSDECVMAGMAQSAYTQMMNSPGINAATGALISEATTQFLDIKWKQNKELFKTEFILALDRAVEAASRHLEESYDTCTEQSAEERSNQSPTTP